MKWSIFLSIPSVFLICSSSVFGQEHLLNGGFEASTPLSQWSVLIGDGSVQAVSSPDVSPFAGVYTSSATSIKLVDGAQMNTGPELSQVFSPISIDAILSFDFKLMSFATDYWVVYPGVYTPTGDPLVANLRIGDTGNFVFAGAGARFSAPITLGEWYHVSVNFDMTDEKMSGDLTEFGGPTGVWSNIPFLQHASGLSYLSISDAAVGPIKNGDLFVDNFSFRQGAPVPEPSCIGMLASIGASVLCFYRIRGRVKVAWAGQKGGTSLPLTEF